MYVGCILTTVGTFLVFGLERDGRVRTDALCLAIFVVGVYVVAMALERQDCGLGSPITAPESART